MDRFEQAKLRIKEKVDLVALVEGYVALRPRGRLMVGLCPFHDEKTPSFTVYPDTQHFHCYGCGKAGDVFSFLMEREGLSFREVFEMLAEREGVSLEGVFGKGGGKPHEPGRRQRRVKEAEHLAAVRDWFREQLAGPAGAAARAYLGDRGLGEAAGAFGLGYHPDPRQDGPETGGLVDFARRRSLPGAVLAQAGLLKRGDGDRIREPFAGRLMFPIEDERGRVVGFGGRVLPRAEEAARARGPDAFQPPKYLNSPESEHFNKRRVLFGLGQVKRAGTRRVVVMEGYTDVIACHLAGLTGAVATLGTALTSDHARLLERWATEGVVLLFDGDAAGRQAAERAFRELAHTRLDLRIALAPEGMDPADLLRGPDPDAGRHRLAAMLEEAEEALTVWFRLLRQRLDLSVPLNVERAAGECGRVLASLDSPVRQEAMAARMSSLLGVRSEALVRHVPRDPRRGEEPAGGPEAPSRPLANGPSPLHGVEMDILSCLLAGPDGLGAMDGVSFSDPKLDALRALLEEEVAAGASAREALVQGLFGRIAERADLAAPLAQCAERSARVGNPRELLPQLLSGHQRYQARQQARVTRQQAQQALAAGDREEADRLTRLYLEQNRRRDPRPSV